jgi:plasmid stabilization system protein ParE
MDRLPLAFHPDARVDAMEAYKWYASRSQDAADAFREELQNAGKAIQRSPLLWASYLFGTHRYLMHRFPFVVIYRIATHQIEVMAVAHGPRRPGYWKNRLELE